MAARSSASPHAPLCRTYAGGGSGGGDRRGSGCKFGAACRFRHQRVCATALPPPAPPAAALTAVPAAAAPACALSLTWPVRPGPPLAAEVSLRGVLLLSESESGRGKELPPARLATITAAAAAVGLPLPAALSLRRLFIRQVSGNAAFFGGRAMGDEAAARSHAARFEALLAAHLAAAGAATTGEEALVAAGAAATPDLLLRPPIAINGAAVCWIDAKTFYGAASCAVLGETPFLPPAKLAAQAARYCRTYGPGAFVFLNGFSVDLARAAELGPGVLLLDATPIAGAAELFDAGEAADAEAITAAASGAAEAASAAPSSAPMACV